MIESENERKCRQGTSPDRKKRECRLAKWVDV